MASIAPIAPTSSTGNRPNTWLAGPVNLIVCVIAGIVPIARLVFGNDTRGFPELIAAILVVLLLLGYFKRPPYWAFWMSALILYPLGGALSGVNSSMRGSVQVALFLGIVLAFTPGVLMRLFYDRPRSVRHITASFIVVQTFSANVAILQFLGITVWDLWVPFGRATGLAGHPNVLAFMSGIVIIICVHLLFFGSRGSLLGLILPVLIVNAGALVASGSLSAMMATAIALLLYLIAARKVIIAGFMALVSLALVLPASGIFLGESTAIFDAIGVRIAIVTGEVDGQGAASADIRTQTYAWAWSHISSSPLVGVGMDPMNSFTFDGKTQVHNHLLRSWYQGGLFVAVWIIVLYVIAIVLAVRAIRRQENFLSVSIIILVLVYGAGSAFMNQMHYWLPLLVAVAVAGHFRQTGKQINSSGRYEGAA